MYILPSWESLKSNNKHYYLIKPIVRLVHLDTNYYLRNNSDLSSMSIQELKNHYVENGYREGRLSWDYKIDPIFMRTEYSDLSMLSDQQIAEHFQNYGYKEGRLPYMPHFEQQYYLEAYGFELEMKQVGQSAEELKRHFISSGYLELKFPYRFWRK